MDGPTQLAEGDPEGLLWFIVGTVPLALAAAMVVMCVLVAKEQPLACSFGRKTIWLAMLVTAAITLIILGVSG